MKSGTFGWKHGLDPQGYAPHFQQSQILIRIFSKPEVMFFHTDVFSTFFLTGEFPTEISYVSDISKNLLCSKGFLRVTARFMKIAPREGGVQRESAPSPEEDFQTISISRRLH